MGLADLQVMVVEDHGFQRRMALRMLGEIGVGTVHDAADGIAALDRLQRLPSPPDILLVDLDMPGMDGVEFIGHVAQQRMARAIALVSALDSAVLNTVPTMARAYGMRVLGGIEKPLPGATLHALPVSYDAVLHADDDDTAKSGARRGGQKRV